MSAYGWGWPGSARGCPARRGRPADNHELVRACRVHGMARTRENTQLGAAGSARLSGVSAAASGHQTGGSRPSSLASFL